MSEMLYLYKELTKMAKANLLDDGSLKFSVTINGQYADMLKELSSRTSMARAELARHLICTALDEIDSVYNLKNDPYFDYSITAQAEEELNELQEHREIQKIQQKFDRISELEFMLDLVSKSEGDPEEKNKQVENIESELKELKEELGQ